MSQKMLVDCSWTVEHIASALTTAKYKSIVDNTKVALNLKQTECKFVQVFEHQGLLGWNTMPPDGILITVGKTILGEL